MICATFLLAPGFVGPLNGRAYDLIADWSPGGKPSDRILLVDIDEKSLGSMGRWPWRRDVLAGVVNRLYDAGAATVVLDLMFPEPDGGHDAVLAAALSRGASVIGYTFRFDGAAGKAAVPFGNPVPVASDAPERGSRPFHASGVTPSVAPLTLASSTGFLNAAPDPDGSLRLIPAIVNFDGRPYPSLALAAMYAYSGGPVMKLEAADRDTVRLLRNENTVPLEGPSCLRLRYRGKERTFAHVSAADVAAGAVSSERLRGKLVVVGGTALGLATAGTIALAPRLPSPEFQATAIDNLLQGDFLHRPDTAGFWEAVFAMALALSAATLLIDLPARWAALALVSLGILVWPCALWLASTGILLSPLPATVAAAGNVAIFAAFHYRQERVRADRTAEALVSSQEQSQKVIASNESRYRLLVENINDAIVVDDSQGCLVFANRRFREWFGIGDGGVRGLASEAFVAPEWRPVVQDLRRRCVNGEEVPDHLEYEGVCADGSRIWIEALITTVEENGRIVGTQSVLRHITERKRLEAQFLQSQKMESIGRLAGGVAHDFNNLLTVINGYSDLILTQLDEWDPVRVKVQQILKAGNQAAELTQQLLTFSRKQVAQAKRLDLNSIVAEAHGLLERVVGEDIEMVRVLSPELGLVMADAGQMQQVLMNLVVNARDGMPHGGRLTIETANVEVDGGLSSRHPELKPGPYVRLSVSDTGVGMTEEVQRQIFEPFFTTKEKGKGTGLGLATVYGIVRHSRGGIWVWSQPGQGSAFHIYLPRVESRTTVQETGAVAEPAQLGWETIVLVEDQDAVRNLAARILESYGYRVLQARTGPDAIALLQQYPETIHLLLTDVILPGMNGRELASALQAARPGMPVLYTSGYPEDVVGGVKYLAKPYSPEDLLAAVQRSLGGRRSGGAGSH